MLSLPGFLLLRISPPRVLARVLWFLTAACGVAWYFGDRADRISSGLPLISDPLENLGMFLNAFTLLFHRHIPVGAYGGNILAAAEGI